MVLSFHTSAPHETQALGAALSGLLLDGDLVVLSGDMGAGKTCFTQGLARGLGVEGRVTSPTFTLANRYEGRLVLNHLDVYRLDDPAETLDLDLPDLLEDGVTVIEWGQQIATVLPAEHLDISIRWTDSDPACSDRGRPGEDERGLTLNLVGPSWNARRQDVAEALAVWTRSC